MEKKQWVLIWQQIICCSKGICIAIFSYLLILISRHRNELRLLEDVGSELAVGKLEDVIGSHQVKTRLVLMHGVEDGLQTENVILLCCRITPVIDTVR